MPPFPSPGTMKSLSPRTPGVITGLIALVLATAQAGCQGSSPDMRAARGGTTSVTPQGAGARLTLPMPIASAPVDESPDEQQRVMLKSARSAWSFVSREASQAGFVGATDNYPYMTVWDMASMFAATWSARELHLITPAQYSAMISRGLGTMEKMPLFDGAAFNKLYAAGSGAMVDRQSKTTTKGYGWSVLDHGRLLVWLRIIGQDDPAFAERTRALVAKLDMNRLVHDGYLMGEDLDPETNQTRSYQEGRVGYEQYAAEGFALWGTRAERALDFGANGSPVTVNDQTVLADRRGGDLLTSEPFVMMGLELGWTGPNWRPLSLSVLAAQEARFTRTGIVTMISEDAVPDPPAYFYYYLLYHDGKSFVVTSPGGTVSDSYPRWVSAKAAFGYHALAPSAYTWRAVKAVEWGSSPSRGWTAGVYEGTKNATKAFNLNTAAVVLESAAYFQRGCAFIQSTCPPKPQR